MRLENIKRVRCKLLAEGKGRTTNKSDVSGTGLGWMVMNIPIKLKLGNLGMSLSHGSSTATRNLARMAAAKAQLHQLHRSFRKQFMPMYINRKLIVGLNRPVFEYGLHLFPLDSEVESEADKDINTAVSWCAQTQPRRSIRRARSACVLSREE